MGKIALTILFSIITVIANCQQEKPLVIKGNELYKKQQYDKAAEEYQKAADINEKNPLAMYNLGNALYKSKKTEAAEKVYDNAAENAKDPNGKSRAVYNKGVALTRQQKLQESIMAYKDALRLIPTDEEARQNLQKALNELKKQQQQQPKEDKKKQDKDKQKQKPNDQPQNKSKLNQKQAEQMLNSLRQEEKKLQQGIQKKNNTGGANGKDW
ncbi:tetratricopeptide repeat protein [Segetibacter aerophilus]|uniref:BatC protein n=1 Tax=Segetibacter aerophilus TaxID=670293 RepID=A0A512BFN4_9BACT|nr:tetratricopeptide repeat protein [Segetibacter aerophilus]GEO10647.1 BatC protein [Segetibacter aerophilus]